MISKDSSVSKFLESEIATGILQKYQSILAPKVRMNAINHKKDKDPIQSDPFMTIPGLDLSDEENVKSEKLPQKRKISSDEDFTNVQILSVVSKPEPKRPKLVEKPPVKISPKLTDKTSNQPKVLRSTKIPIEAPASSQMAPKQIIAKEAIKSKMKPAPTELSKMWVK